MDNVDLSSELLKAFAARFHRISTTALNATTKEDVSKETGRLTLCEKQREPPTHAQPPALCCVATADAPLSCATVFDMGRRAMHDYTTWRCQKETKIERSQLIDPAPKRRKLQGS